MDHCPDLTCVSEDNRQRGREGADPCDVQFVVYDRQKDGSIKTVLLRADVREGCERRELEVDSSVVASTVSIHDHRCGGLVCYSSTNKSSDAAPGPSEVS